MEITALKMVCGCPWGEVTHKASHSTLSPCGMHLSIYNYVYQVGGVLAGVRWAPHSSAGGTPLVCTVCVCVCVCVHVCTCMCAGTCACACVCIFCIIMLEHLSIYIYKKMVTFSISMYIMCVCLFSALSRRVGALQISIIIIIITTPTEVGSWRKRITMCDHGLTYRSRWFSAWWWRSVLGLPQTHPVPAWSPQKPCPCGQSYDPCSSSQTLVRKERKTMQKRRRKKGGILLCAYNIVTLQQIVVCL